MRTTRNLLGPVTRLVIVAGVVAGFAGCSWDAYTAQRELKRRGIERSPEVLVESIRTGDGDRLTLLLRAGLDPDARTADGAVAMAEALRQGRCDFVAELIASGADANGQLDLQPYLLGAASRGLSGSCRALMLGGADGSVRDHRGRTALHVALEEGHPAAAMALMRRIPLDAADEGGRTAMHLAARQGWFEVVRDLLAYGANPMLQDNAGRTAASFAVAGGHDRVARMILARTSGPQAAGVGRTDVDWLGTRPDDEVLGLLMGATSASSVPRHAQSLVASAERGDVAAMEQVLRGGVPLEAVGADGRTALMAAAAAGHGPLLNDLLKRGASVKAADRTGATALHHAVRGGRGRHSIEILAAAGTPLDVSDHRGETALLAALTAGDGLGMGALLGAGASVEAGGEPPLVRAARLGRFEALAELVGRGADLGRRDENQRTALNWVVARGDVNGIDLLMRAPQAAGADQQAPELTLTAICSNQVALAMALLEGGARLDLSDKAVCVRLREARRTSELARLLTELESGTPLGGSNRSVLFDAVVRGQTRFVELLLQAGAPADTAWEQPLGEEFAKLVDSNQVKSYLRHDTGVTPLMLASALGNIEMVDLLLAHGARKNTHTTKWKAYPINFAALSDHVAVMQMLLGVRPGSATDDTRIVISLRNQSATLYRAGKPVKVTAISTGRAGYETPRGTFVVTNKYKDWTSTIYDAKMPFFQRLNCAAFGLHAGHVPGYPASHGCIRLPPSVAQQFFAMTRLGTVVKIE